MSIKPYISKQFHIGEPMQHKIKYTASSYTTNDGKKLKLTSMSINRKKLITGVYILKKN